MQTVSKINRKGKGTSAHLAEYFEMMRFNFCFGADVEAAVVIGVVEELRWDSYMVNNSMVAAVVVASEDVHDRALQHGEVELMMKSMLLAG